MKMKIYILCTVRNATQEYRERLEKYVKGLEDYGHKVHLPHRDTDQNGTSIEICDQNKKAIEWSDEVHIFFNSESQGSFFDLGMAFMLTKTIKVIETESFDYVDENGNYKKSFPLMLEEWESESEYWNKK